MEKEKLLVEINPEDGSYSADFKYCNKERLKLVLEDIIQKIEEGDFLVVNENSNTLN